MVETGSMEPMLMRYRIACQYGPAFHTGIPVLENTGMHKTVAAILADLMEADLDAQGRPISANELARRTGVPQPTITRILKGESQDPDTATLAPLARYYSITVSQLRGEEPLIRDAKIRAVVHAMEQMQEYQKDAMVKMGDTLTQSPPKAANDQ